MAKSLSTKAGSKLDVAVRGVLYALLALYCFSLLVPLFWLLINSLKTYDDYILHTFQLPQVWTFENYSEAFRVFRMDLTAKSGDLVRYGMDYMLLYSFLWSFCHSFINVFFTTLVAYVIAKYQFFGRKFLYGLGIVIMIIPIVGSLPSSMYFRKMLGIHDNMFLLLVTSPSTVFSGLHFLLMYACFKQIPRAYAEAVFIDGGNHYTVLFRTMLPMAFPSAVAIFVLQFLAAWNDYNTFLIWLPSYPSLSLGLFVFQYNASSKGIGVSTVLASFVIVMIPTIVLYVCTQGILLSKFTVGGLKG